MRVLCHFKAMMTENSKTRQQQRIYWSGDQPWKSPLHTLIWSSAQFRVCHEVQICERSVQTIQKNKKEKAKKKKKKKDYAKSKTNKQNWQKTFENSWKTSMCHEDRKWLCFDSDRNLMFCHYCITSARLEKLLMPPLVAGADKFCVEKIKASEESKPLQGYNL